MIKVLCAHWMQWVYGTLVTNLSFPHNFLCALNSKHVYACVQPKENFVDQSFLITEIVEALFLNHTSLNYMLKNPHSKWLPLLQGRLNKMEQSFGSHPQPVQRSWIKILFVGPLRNSGLTSRPRNETYIHIFRYSVEWPCPSSRKISPWHTAFKVSILDSFSVLVCILNSFDIHFSASYNYFSRCSSTFDY